MTDARKRMRQAAMCLGGLLLVFCSGIEAEIQPKHEDPPPFVPAEKITFLDSALKTGEVEAVDLDLPEKVVERLVRTLRSTKAGKRKQSESGRLGPDGCFSYWPPHSEMRYASTQRLTRLEEMVAAAREEEVVLGTVLSVTSGFFGGRFGTEVKLHEKDLCGERAQKKGPEFMITLFLQQYDLLLDDERLCLSRPGFYFPQQGDDLLVLGVMVNTKARVLAAANFFKVTGNAVELQPYDFLEGNSETELDRLLECRP